MIFFVHETSQKWFPVVLLKELIQICSCGPVALLLILFVVLTKKCREATLDFTFWSTNKYYENADNAVLNDTFKFTICAS